jgi:Family of unknown function (DUF6788)
MKTRASALRGQLLAEIEHLARQAIHGTLSESYRTCGNPGCRCHHGGPKHGPHVYISYRGASGKTTGYYVPKAAEASIRRGVEAWASLQECMHQLAALNKERAMATAAKKEPHFRNRL